MEKGEIVFGWVEQAEEDWIGAKLLFQAGHYGLSLFVGHLVLEKYCKALWLLKNEENVPPKTHNLIRLISESNITTSESTLENLVKVNIFQIEGRYPEKIQSDEKQINFEIAEEGFKIFSELREWLINQLELTK